MADQYQVKAGDTIYDVTYNVSGSLTELDRILELNTSEEYPMMLPDQLIGGADVPDTNRFETYTPDLIIDEVLDTRGVEIQNLAAITNRLPFNSSTPLLDQIYAEMDDITERWVTPLVLEFTITTPNTTGKLPLRDNVSVRINWGDGSDLEEHRGDSPTHLFESVGVYQVSITGRYSRIGTSGFSGEEFRVITRVLSWGSGQGVTSLLGAFQSCINLVSVSNPDDGVFTDITTFAQMFYGCTSLVSIPPGLFRDGQNSTNYSGIFQNCTALTAIPNGLFDNAINNLTFQSVFQNTSSLTSIPSDIFYNSVNVTSFGATFNGSGITSIPQGIFDMNVNAFTFNNVFQNCRGLTTLPDGLFKNNPLSSITNGFGNCTNLVSLGNNMFGERFAATTLLQTFNTCTSITSIPEDLFINCRSLTSLTSTFLSMRSLTSVPENLLDPLVNLRSVQSAFSDTGLTSIPNLLFNNNKNIETFNTCFNGCTSLTGTTPEDDGGKLWERQGKPGYPTNITSDRCFTGATRLTDYNEIPSTWK